MRTDNFRLRLFASSLSILLLLAGCERMVTSRHARTVKEADWKAAQGDYLWAINLYESALDGTPHLVLNPEGSHAAEVRDFMHRDEVALGTSLSGDSVVTRAEAARLRNENLNLHRQIDEGRPRAPATTKSPNRHSEKEKSTASQIYVVKEGDTLASISRKFYQTSKRWRDIRDANENKIDDPDNLKAGLKLKIPLGD
jgi:LysM repeat protein